jgi:hypothetical protein
VTEAEWLAATDPTSMLEFVRGKVSDRKLRLFAIGCCRAAELVRGDSSEPRGAWIQMEEEADQLPCDFESVPVFDDQNRVVGSVRLGTAYFAACDVVRFVGKRRGDILREICGNPFRPVTVAPSWLTATVVSLAEGIYADRAFDRLPILADALQDAGCDNEDILAHCRSDGPHVRGCWVVDRLLGKE